MSTVSKEFAGCPNDIRVIYTISPIDLGGIQFDWRTEFKRLLVTSNVNAVIFDPLSAYKITQGVCNYAISKYIEEINTIAIEKSDIVVCILPRSVLSVGSCVEIDLASKLSKSLYLITDVQHGSSVYLNNRVYMDNWFVSDMSQDSIITQLEKIKERIVSHNTLCKSDDYAKEMLAESQILPVYDNREEQSLARTRVSIPVRFDEDNQES